MNPIPILRSVIDLGYLVMVDRQGDEIAIIAVKGSEIHRCSIDEADESGLYLAACALAVSVGIDLE